MNDLPLQHQSVLILVGPDFEDREVFYPQLRFIEAGAQVILAGLGEPRYVGKYGIPIDVHGPCESFQDQSWNIVIVPGGWAPDKIRMNQAALNIVRTACENGAIVGAICHGGWVLASAKVLQGKKVTSYAAIKDDMLGAGALEWVDQAVVVDGPLVTSRTPSDLPVFCRTIIQQACQIPALV